MSNYPTVKVLQGRLERLLNEEIRNICMGRYEDMHLAVGMVSGFRVAVTVSRMDDSDKDLDFESEECVVASCGESNAS